MHSGHIDCVKSGSIVLKMFLKAKDVDISMYFHCGDGWNLGFFLSFSVMMYSSKLTVTSNISKFRISNQMQHVHTNILYAAIIPYLYQ